MHLGRCGHANAYVCSADPGPDALLRLLDTIFGENRHVAAGVAALESHME